MPAARCRRCRRCRSRRWSASSARAAERPGGRATADEGCSCARWAWLRRTILRLATRFGLRCRTRAPAPLRVADGAPRGGTVRSAGAAPAHRAEGVHGAYAPTGNFLPLARTNGFLQTWYRGDSLAQPSMLQQVGWRIARQTVSVGVSHTMEIVLGCTPKTFDTLEPTF